MTTVKHKHKAGNTNPRIRIQPHSFADVYVKRNILRQSSELDPSNHLKLGFFSHKQ